MFSYPLGRTNVYINNRDLSEYYAKLSTNYHISGYTLTNSYHQGPSRSSILLLRQTYGLLSITLPLEFWAQDKEATMACLAAFNGDCGGQVEITLPDGFSYTCLLSETTETEWLNDAWCAVDYTFVGIRHRAPVEISKASPLRIRNSGTWPRNDCTITVKGLAVKSPVPVVVGLSDGKETYLTWRIDTSGGLYTGGDLVLDGVKKQNLYNGGNIPTGTMTWTDYPYLRPGVNTISVSGGLSAAELELYYTPAYL